METLTTWKTKLIDAGDGSGDAIVELPDAILNALGWIEGDMLDITLEENTLLLKKVANNI